MTTCLNDKCGREIVQGQWGAEGDGSFAERLASGYCRGKCRRLSAPPKKERVTGTLDAVDFCYDKPELVAQVKEVPQEDPKYLAWIRSLPCLVPGCEYASQAHHQNEAKKGAKGATTSDYRALPLCPWHHTLGGTPGKPGSYHGLAKLTGWTFWRVYGVDVEATIHRLNALWMESGKKFK